tara:strand:+ start:1483 stop:1959 length:477 start_codon:yes stop_codon:yes gene_type:complete
MAKAFDNTPANVITLLKQVRKQIQPIKRDGKNPHFGSHYATLDNVIEAVTSPLDDAGFFLTHRTFGNEHGMFVQTSIIYEEDRNLVLSTDIPIVLHKQDMQALGGAITYARRYGILSLLNLPTEDDDGNLASAPTKRDASDNKSDKPVANIWKDISNG